MGKKHKKYSKELKTIFPPRSNIYIYIYRIVKPKSGKRGGGEYGCIHKKAQGGGTKSF